MNNVITIDVTRESTSGVDAELLLAMRGEKGETGETPRLTVGTVSTLTPESDATVTITGTTEDPVLNFGIPHGIKGDTGDTGETGNGIYSIYFDDENRLTVELDDGQSATSEPVTETVKIDAYLIHFDKVETLAEATSTIDLDMTGYSYDSTDIVFVSVNGLFKIPTIDYTLTDTANGAIITFTSALSASDNVFIRVIKARTDFSLLMTAVGSTIVTDDDEAIGI